MLNKTPQLKRYQKGVKPTPSKIRGKVRYNWDALKLEFMTGPWTTVTDFRRYKGMPPPERSQYIAQKTVGWAKEKKEMVSLAVKKAAANLVDDTAERIKKSQKRHFEVGRKMLDKGESSLKWLTPTSVDEARKLIATSVQIERDALGIGQKGGAKSLTQVNVNLPKTQFDEIIDAEDFEGILKLVAEIKRERTQRAGRSIAKQSQAEAEQGRVG